MVVDSTAQKVFGEGEWEVRKHGVSKLRTRRKVHIGIDEAAHEVVAAIGTINAVDDGGIFPNLLCQIDDNLDHV